MSRGDKEGSTGVSDSAREVAQVSELCSEYNTGELLSTGARIIGTIGLKGLGWWIVGGFTSNLIGVGVVGIKLGGGVAGVDERERETLCAKAGPGH